MSQSKNLIPKEIANACPDKCDKCNKKIIGVFRTWKPKASRVSVEFVHKAKGSKSCFKSYDY